VRDFDIYQVGYRLGAVRDFLRDSSEAEGQFDRLERTLATVAVATGGREPAREPDTTTDEYFIARIALGILQRGISSLTSPALERAIRSTTTELEWTESPDNAEEITFGVNVSGVNRVEFLRKALVSAHIASDPRAEADWSAYFDSKAEETFLERRLVELLGPGVALVEAQRAISSMLPNSKVALNFVGRRVDFALETSTGLKVVFEVDGPHHHADPNQQRLDLWRDNALEEAGWLIERIQVDALRSNDLFSADLHERIEADVILCALRNLGSQEILDNDLNVDAMRLVLTPNAVARIQFAVLLALMQGTLKFDADSWTIAVIERDVSCAHLAMLDLVYQLSHLCTLYGVTWTPAIDLIVRDETDLNLSVPAADTLDWPYQNAVYVKEVMAEELSNWPARYDLLIDVSVRARPADSFPNHQRHRGAYRNARSAYKLRTAYHSAPERFLQWPVPRAIDDALQSKPSLEYFLQLVFRKTAFRELQDIVIARALQHRSLIGLLPTGSGKSITFQLPAILSPGIALVICPLKALMDDQVDNLERAGIDRSIAIHSGKDQIAKQIAIDLLMSGSERFLYIAPERFQMKAFRDDLEASAVGKSVSFVVVDEAHCVSEWGHDFRPAYLNVGQTARKHCRNSAGEPPILALTGTASMLVLLDIQRELALGLDDENAIISPPSFYRKELSYLCRSSGTRSEQKQAKLQEALSSIADQLGTTPNELLSESKNGGLVFCRHVDNDFGVDQVRPHIETSFELGPDRVKLYAGRRPASMEAMSPEEFERYKTNVQKAFKNNEFPILVSTSSFGMGIDKPNIRYTVH
jgi:ATP-dependent DNA helicase RecQ